MLVISAALGTTENAESVAFQVFIATLMAKYGNGRSCSRRRDRSRLRLHRRLFLCHNRLHRNDFLYRNLRRYNNRLLYCRHLCNGCCHGRHDRGLNNRRCHRSLHQTMIASQTMIAFGKL